ncbi:MAG: MoaD/ThiS family protein [Acidimicrobiia bacterium]
MPVHLRTLAGVVERELTVELDGPGPPTAGALLDALEDRYPVLRGTIRGHAHKHRRPFIRFFGGEDDLSHEPSDAPLPDAVADGKEPFHIVGAMAGG